MLTPPASQEPDIHRYHLNVAGASPYRYRAVDPIYSTAVHHRPSPVALRAPLRSPSPQLHNAHLRFRHRGRNPWGPSEPERHRHRRRPHHHTHQPHRLHVCHLAATPAKPALRWLRFAVTATPPTSSVCRLRVGHVCATCANPSHLSATETNP